MSRRPARRRSNTVPPTGLLGVRVLDALHRLVVQAEVMTELVDDGFTHELRHLLLVDAVFLDRPLVDRHRVGERSEEHTSELQSRLHLVCRLLLEKKKPKHT